MAGERAINITVNIKTKEAVKAVKDVGRSFKTLANEAEKSGRRINRMDRSLRGLRNSARSLMAAFATLGVGVGLERLGDMIDLTTSMEISIRSLANTQEDAAVIQAAVDAQYQRSAQSMRDLANTTRMLLAFDFAKPGELIPVLQAMDDASAALGVSMTQIAFAVGQIKAMGFLRGEEARQLRNLGVNVEGAISRMFQSRGQDIDQAEVRRMIEERLISAGDTIEALFREWADRGFEGFSQELLAKNPYKALEKLSSDFLVALSESVVTFKDDIEDAIDFLRNTVIPALELAIELLGEIKDRNKGTGQEIVRFFTGRDLMDANLSGPEFERLYDNIRLLQDLVPTSFLPGGGIIEGMLQELEDQLGQAIGRQTKIKEETEETAVAAKEHAAAIEQINDGLVHSVTVMSEYGNKLQTVMSVMETELGAGRFDQFATDISARLLDAQVDAQRMAIEQGSATEAEAIQAMGDLRVMELQNALAEELILHAEHATALQQLYGQLIENTQNATADAVEAALERAAEETQRVADRQAEERFNAARQAGMELFDALTTRANSFGDALKNILRATLLTPLRRLTGELSGVLFGGGSMSGILNRSFGGGILGTALGIGSPLTGGFAGGGGAAAILSGGGGAAAGTLFPGVGTAFGSKGLMAALSAVPGWGWVAAGAAIGGLALFKAFSKSTKDRVEEAAKEMYGVSLDNSTAKAIADIIGSRYGNNVLLGMQSAEVKDIIQLYSQSIGQGQNLGHRPTPVSLYGSAGQIYQKTPELSGGPRLNAGLNNSTVVIQMPNPQTVVNAAGMTVIDRNPQLVAAAVDKARTHNYNRRESLSLSMGTAFVTG